MSIEEIALRLIESDCSTDYYFKILDELGNNTTKIQELEKEKLHIEIAYDEDYKEQQQEIERLNGALQTHEILLKSNVLEIERLNNIINEIERYINEEYIYDELGMKIFDASKLQDKLQELKGVDKE